VFVIWNCTGSILFKIAINNLSHSVKQKSFLFKRSKQKTKNKKQNGLKEICFFTGGAKNDLSNSLFILLNNIFIIRYIQLFSGVFENLKS